MLIVLSGPSGVGKSFVINKLINEFDFEFIVPYTSRSKRENEVDGVDYNFRTPGDLFKLSSGFRSGFWAKLLGDDIYGYKTIPRVHQLTLSGLQDVKNELK
ncbi:MAG: hypothetical protein D3903_21780 [Candidatus Electrothrix sp. GM3_4]|nr:hypothetical protein [Candidatus Electrothrix sp. GM3_4]